MAEWLERWLPNHKVSSSNLSDRKILESFKKYIVENFILVIEFCFLEIVQTIE